MTEYFNIGVPGESEIRSIKQANRKNRVRPVNEMLLMMFRSAARERGRK